MVTAYVNPDSDRKEIQIIAEQIGVTPIYEIPDISDAVPFLRLASDGLSLTDGKLELFGDFTRMLPRIKQENLRRELLLRAAKIKNFGENPTAADATAGLGEDSLLLAAAGFSVHLYEYNPVIAALLSDTLRRAAEVPELAETVSRMHLTKENSESALSLLPSPPDLILLDPMFPARQKSGLVKKKFQLLHGLESPCTDEAALLNAAISAQPRKIIVKRPSKGPFLAGVKPSYSIEGGGIRFDCIVR